MATLLEDYLDSLRQRRGARKQARYLFPRFFAYLADQGVLDPRETREEHLIGYARSLKTTPTRRGNPFSLWSQRAYLSAVRGFFAHLTRRRLILHDPAADLPMPFPRSLPRVVLKETQVARLMDSPSTHTAFGQRDRAMLELLYGVGLRQSECLRLDVADIDLFEGRLLVRDGKGHKDRVVPILGQAAQALDRYLRDGRLELVKDPSESALFLSKYGWRLSQTQLQTIVKAHARAASIPVPVSPHVLRHTCATHLLKGGADIRHIQGLLGHARIETTALYARVALVDLRQVIARAHPRERQSR